MDKIYFDIVKSMSSLSKDESLKVGAAILDEEGKVVSMGYNGCFTGAKDEDIPYTREVLSTPEHYTGESFEAYKRDYMIHAEMNALLTADSRERLKGSTLYITHYPCNNCALALAQSKVGLVKVLDRKTNAYERFHQKSRYILSMAKIPLYFYDEDYKLLGSWKVDSREE
jgi:dCMP deaminase